eukprot:8087945-Alexandrium_andersonii.AAC.1
METSSAPSSARRQAAQAPRSTPSSTLMRALLKSGLPQGRVNRRSRAARATTQALPPSHPVRFRPVLPGAPKHPGSNPLASRP